MGETAAGTVGQTPDAGGIIDTDILVDALRGVTTAIAFLNDAESALTVAVITYLELIQGCRNTTSAVWSSLSNTLPSVV